MRKLFVWGALAGAIAYPLTVAAENAQSIFLRCATIKDDKPRLACFDQLNQDLQKPTAAAPKPPPGAGYEFETTSIELSKAYDANTVSADGRFKGKTFLVRGVVASINTGMTNDVYVTMKGMHPYMQPQFALQDSEKQRAGALGKGQKVALICVGAGDLAKTPMSRKCVFAGPG